jgi:hypothetical protein
MQIFLGYMHCGTAGKKKVPKESITIHSNKTGGD